MSKQPLQDVSFCPLLTPRGGIRTRKKNPFWQDPDAVRSLEHRCFPPPLQVGEGSQIGSRYPWPDPYPNKASLFVIRAR